MAALLTFLLAPLVTRLEQWLRRILAVLVVAAMIFVATGTAGRALTRQIIDLGIKLPEYQENIVTKLRAFRTPKSGAFLVFSHTVDELTKERPGGSAEQRTPTVIQDKGRPETAVTSPPAPPAVPVKMVEKSRPPPNGK